ncbi:aldehyde dehydrogenase family-domain-containing protein [Xylaria sp. FL1042]|nr:aldehyde dehydrogenase family-domain-containing protein [Xylaria sp. FL1042]
MSIDVDSSVHPSQLHSTNPTPFPTLLEGNNINPLELTTYQNVIDETFFFLSRRLHAPYCLLKVVELGLWFFPRGILPALSGADDLENSLTAHVGIDKVSFIRSCSIGENVVQVCGAGMKRVATELSGNDPAVVCEDVDPAIVAQRIMTVVLARPDQLCLAIKRVYVHESVYDAVLDEMVKYVENVKVSNPLKDAYVGPISNHIENPNLDVMPKHAQSVEGFNGFFIRPIIVRNPPDDARVVVEEAFGPIVPIVKWLEEAEVIQRAINTDFGLDTSVWSRDLVQAGRIANKQQAGNVYIDTHGEVQGSNVFAGYKHSGIGTNVGIDGLKGWCNIQSLYTRPLR